jgi:hypothetical protein
VEAVIQGATSGFGRIRAWKIEATRGKKCGRTERRRDGKHDVLIAGVNSGTIILQ